MIGANIKAQGTDTGTITDLDGNFTLSVPEDATKLEISFVGMKSVVATVKPGKHLKVVLEEDNQTLDEVVVVGYGYSFGGTALVGDPTDPDILKQGGVENCDAVAAVSEDDSVNLMAAQIAKNIFRREKVICRVSDPHLQVLYHKTYELDTICPTILTEQAVFRALAK